MIPYQFVDYRKALVAIVQRRRQTESTLTYARVAEAGKVQATYFSNVLKGRGDFSSDQLFLILSFLAAEESERDYCLLLLDWNRCEVPARKSSLKERVEAFRQKFLATQRHLTATPVNPESTGDIEYYLDPMVQIVHVYLGLPAYAKDVKKIQSEIGLSAEHLQRTLRLLERLGYVQLDRHGHYKSVVKNRHLPQTSPVCLPHQTLMRLKSAEQMSRLPDSHRYHVSVTLSTAPEVLDEIRAEFLVFLKKAEAAVKGAPEEKVFQMNFDLFPWSL